MNDRTANVLLIDDEAELLRPLVGALERIDPNISFHTAADPQQALIVAKELKPEVVVADLSIDPSIGPQSGLDLIGEIAKLDRTTRILALTGHKAEDYGIEALQRGAASFLEKPADPKHLIVLISDGISFCRLKRNYLQLISNNKDLSGQTGITTNSALMRQALEKLLYAASNNQAVLLVGETGTGKGVLASTLHNISTRHKGPFVRFQPSFTGHDLVSSELFAPKKGAFTGATADRRGLIEEADGGTLFIDEVDQLPQETQVALLNVIQEKTFRRLGDNKELRSDFRLITASNKKTTKLIGEDSLREDFYHRISHCTIKIPALRERSEDIEQLAVKLLQSIANNESLPIQGLSEEALKKLTSYNWPGNIRELQSVVEGSVYHACFMNRHFVEETDVSFGPHATEGEIATGSFRQQVRDFESRLISDAMSANEGNQSKAAQSLGLDRSSFRRILTRSQR